MSNKLFFPISTRFSNANFALDRTSIIVGSRWHNCERGQNSNIYLSGLLDIAPKEIEYSTDQQGFLCENEYIFSNSEHPELKFGDRPLLNLTTLDVGEIWTFIRLLAQGSFENLDFFYCSPNKYSGEEAGSISKRTPLALETGEWCNVPGLATEWNVAGDQFLILGFLGFDLYRLGSIESYEGFPDNTMHRLVLADPPTSPHWTERTLRENHELIDNVLRQGFGSVAVLRISGVCPSATFSQLKEMFDLRDNNERVCIIPLGPRTQSLGSLVFVSNELEVTNSNQLEPRVGVLYDYPSPVPQTTTMSEITGNAWHYRLARLN